MALLGQAWVTIATKDNDLRTGLKKAHGMVLSGVSSMQSALSSLVIGGIGAGGLVMGIKAGIDAVDDFKMSTISIAATLTDMAKKGTGDLKQIYDANLQYATETYQKIELQSAKTLASGKELTDAWQIFSQKGVQITSDKDVENMGIIVDRIKLSTQGQDANKQIAQEIRALIDGQARVTDQVAMMMQDRIGPAWKQQVESAREQGTLVQFLAEKLSGLKVAQDDISKLWTNQITYLGTLVTQTGRAGLAGAYEDIVNSVQILNDYLKENKENISFGIREIWNDIKTTIQDPVWKDFFGNILTGGRNTLEGIKDSLSVLHGLVRDYNSLPSEIAGAAGTGIVGRMLFGSWKIGTILGMLSLIESAMKSIREQNEKGQLGSTGSAIVDSIYGSKKNRHYIDINGPGTWVPGTEKPEVEMPPKDMTKVVGASDIDKQIANYRQSIMDALNSISAQSAINSEEMMKNSGRFYDAERIRIDQWVKESEAAFQKRVDSLGQSVIEMEQALSKAQQEGKTITPEAVSMVQELRREWQSLKAEIPGYNKLIEDSAANQKAQFLKNQQLQGSKDIAELNVQYAELTGNHNLLYEAKIALINATQSETQANENADIPGLADAYQRLYEKQRQIEQIKGGSDFFAGLRLGFADTSSSIQTVGELGMQVAGDLRSGFSDVFSGLISGAGDVEDRFLRMLDNIESKLMDLWMNQAWNSLFGGGSMGGILGLLGLGGGGGGGFSYGFGGGGGIGSGDIVWPKLDSGPSGSMIPKVPSTGSKADVSLHVNLKNESGSQLKVEQKGMSRDEMGNMVIDLILSDYTRGGKTYHAWGRRS